MSDVQDIDSGTLLENVERHFRVVAGPGAGKTHWLVNHIRNVVQNSTRMSPVSRIGCISYTNTAVSELITRLGKTADQVDVSTIHSFLYRNVVKPYLHWLKHPDGRTIVDCVLLDGHDVHHPSGRKLDTWLRSNNGQQLLAGPFKTQKDLLTKQLTSLTWNRLPGGGWELAAKKLERLNKLAAGLCTHDILLAYKTMYWDEGTIDHEDVLYFAHRILEEHPESQAFLAARFRYLFIDEFQDTTPVQAEMVKMLASHGTIVGVIGDGEQSIYNFVGTTPEDFRTFSLPNHLDLRIAGNRRSTNQIVDILNRVRTDGLRQVSLGNVDGDPPTVYVGVIEKVVPAVRAELPADATLWVLARKNTEVAAIRRLDESSSNVNAWKSFEDADWERCLFNKSIVAAVELAQQENFTQALQTLIRGIGRRGAFRAPLKHDGEVTEVMKRGVGVCILEFMIANLAEMHAKSVLDVYRAISDQLPTMVADLKAKQVREGSESKFKVFAEATQFSLLCSTVHLGDNDTRDIRTIHKAKGAEADCVLVCLANKAQVEHLFAATTPASDEERRLTYVALSRAKTRLMVCIPRKFATEQSLKDAGFSVRTVV